jgi:hypothetical protein
MARQYPGEVLPVLFGHDRKTWDDGPGPLEADNVL